MARSLGCCAWAVNGRRRAAHAAIIQLRNTQPRPSLCLLPVFTMKSPVALGFQCVEVNCIHVMRSCKRFSRFPP